MEIKSYTKKIVPTVVGFSIAGAFTAIPALAEKSSEAPAINSEQAIVTEDAQIQNVPDYSETSNLAQTEVSSDVDDSENQMEESLYIAPAPVLDAETVEANEKAQPLTNASSEDLEAVVNETETNTEIQTVSEELAEKENNSEMADAEEQQAASKEIKNTDVVNFLSSVDNNTTITASVPEESKDKVEDILDENKDKADSELTEKAMSLMKDNGFNDFLTRTVNLTSEQKQGLSENQVMELYDKYLAQYRVEGSDKLFDFERETYNPDGSLSEASKQQALDIINFMRELAGLGTVEWDSEYDNYAQSGVDFLDKNNLDIDHSAAAGKDDVANEGLTSSNLAQGGSRFSLWDLLLGLFADDDVYNKGTLGHRAWLMNPNATKFGLGYVNNGVTAYLAVYVIGDLNLGDGTYDGFSDVNGSIPVEILDEIRSSVSYPWLVGFDSDTDINTNDNYNKDIKVTITDSDGNTYEFKNYSDASDVDTDDWFRFSSVNGQVSMVINPYSIYAKYGYQGLIGKSFTITVSGLVDKDGNPLELKYNVDFFSLLDALETREVNKKVVEDFTNDVNSIPSDLSWENYETIKAMKEAYDNMTDAQKALLDQEIVEKMNDAYETSEGLYQQRKEDEKVAQGVVNKIDAIGEVDLSSGGVIEEARKAYDSLTDTQKAIVDPSILNKLVEAEKQYDMLVAKDKADKEAVAGFVALVNKIPDEITLSDSSVIEAARKGYDALTADQKKMVNASDLSKLTGAENAYQVLVTQEADKAEAQKVMDLINKLPAEVSLEDETAINAARSAYSGLSERQKGYVDSVALTRLEQAEQKIAEIKLQNKEDSEAASEVEAAINQIPSEVTLKDETTINAAQNLYNALTDQQKALVAAESVQKLESAQKSLQTLKQEQAENMAKADAVEALIDQIPNEVRLDDEAAVQKARSAYDELSDTAKGYVEKSFIQKLENAEKTIVVLKQEKIDQEAADRVTGLIAALPEAITLDNRDDVEAALKAYNNLTESQKAKVDQEKLKHLNNLVNTVIPELEADVVEEVINALPKAITLEEKEAVAEARAKYNALSDKAKGFVDSSVLTLLENAEKEISRLEQVKADTEAADQMNLLLQSMKEPSAVTLEDEAYLNNLQYTYDQLSDGAKGMVDENLVNKLKQCMNRIEVLKQEAAIQAEVQKVIDQINALPAELTLDDKASVEAARKAYDSLSKEAKEQISKETLSKLAAAEQKLSELEAEKPVDPEKPVEPEKPGEGDIILPESPTLQEKPITADQKDKTDATAAVSQNGKTPGTGIENRSEAGAMVSILAAFGIGGLAFWKKRRKENR